MKQLLIFCLVSFLTATTHAEEMPAIAPKEIPETPISDAEYERVINTGNAVSSKAGVEARHKAQQPEREKALAELRLNRESMTELERLATREGYYHPPEREEVLPYRFNDVSRLQSMLQDPKWSRHWSSIVTTIGMAADKAAALGLIEFIKSAPLPKGYEREAAHAKMKAITALAHTLYDQDVPEVLDFLHSLTDAAYVEKVSVGHTNSIQSVRYHAFLSLAAAATNESLAILESLLGSAKTKKEQMVVQSLSAGGAAASSSEETVDDDIEMLEQYLSFGRNRRAGVAPESDGKWMQ